MRRAFGKSALLMAVIMLWLCTSACVKSSHVITIDSKGMAYASIKLLGPGVEMMRNDIVDAYPSCNVEKVKERDLEGYKFSFAPVRAEDLRLPGLPLSPVIVKDAGLFYDTYSLSCLSVRRAAEDKEYRQQFTALKGCLNTGGSMYWSISLPYEPISHNAGRCEDDGKTLIWTTSDLMARFNTLDALIAGDGSVSAEQQAQIDADWIQATFRIYHPATIISVISMGLMLLTVVAVFRGNRGRRDSDDRAEEVVLYGPEDDHA